MEGEVTSRAYLPSCNLTSYLARSLQDCIVGLLQLLLLLLLTAEVSYILQKAALAKGCRL